MQKNSQKPPKITSWFLERILKHSIRYGAIGDFTEKYSYILNKRGRRIANFWYRWQLTQLFLSFTINQINWSKTMFKNYLKTTLRSIKRQKLYSAINILGLSIALSCCVLIYLFVSDELSFDKFHKNRDLLFRIVRLYYNENGTLSRGENTFPALMADELTQYMPDIKNITRYRWDSGIIQVNGNVFREFVTMVDPAFLEMFSYRLIQGNPKTALSGNNSVVLPNQAALKFFGRDEPVGKTITIAFGQNKYDYTVTGVLEDPPRNTTVGYNILMNISNAKRSMGTETFNSWGDWTFPFYVLLKNNTDKKSVEDKFTGFYDRFFKERDEQNPRFKFHLQNIIDIRLNPEIRGGSDPKTLYILSGIALSVLIVACINFVNMSIGMSAVRSMEIGIRKVVGASKSQLVKQFWSESAFMSIIAMILGTLIAIFLLSGFNEISGKQLVINDIIRVNNILFLLMIGVLTGIFSGSYSAVILANFKTVDIFSGKMKIGGKKLLTRTLIILQFSLSVFFIVSSMTMNKQLKFLLTRNPGFNTESLINVYLYPDHFLRDENFGKIVELYRTKVENNPNILGFTACASHPANISTNTRVTRNGIKYIVYQNSVYYDFLKTMGIELVEGRDFSRDFVLKDNEVIVNEKLVKELGIEDPVGKMLGDAEDKYWSNKIIVGVMKDYNFRTFRNEIAPFMIHAKWNNSRILIRLSNYDTGETIAFLENVWKEIQPDKPFRYTFMSDNFENFYGSERNFRDIVKYSSIFSLLIACMGIFGLTSVILSRRIKEIGIRKVLGASFNNIVRLLSREFIILVLTANVIAWPAAYYFLNDYLSDYAYRINISMELFVFAAVLSVLITLLTIGFQTVRAARSNPVDSLRDE